MCQMTVVIKDIKRLCLLFSAALLTALAISLPAKADNIIQGYNSKETLQAGLLVALDKSAAKSVKILPGSDSDHIFGVVIDPSDAPFTLNGQNSKVFVATSGNFPVLVSTVNGTIKPGDFVSASNLSGIGQKAATDQARVAGQAVSGFDGTSNVITTNGKSQVGRILVQLNPQNNPLANNAVLVPSALRKASSAVAGRSVPAIRIYAALGVFLFSAGVAILVLWSGVRGSIIALGRFFGDFTTVLVGAGTK